MQQTVIFLKRDRMEVYRVEEGVKTVKAETTWNDDNLVEKLRLVKNKFETNSARVLVAREIAGTEMVLDLLAEAATEAKLTIEAVQDESLIEDESDRVVALALKDLTEKSVEEEVSYSPQDANVAEVKMSTEVVKEVATEPEPQPVLRPLNIAETPQTVQASTPVRSVGQRVDGGNKMKIVWIALSAVLVLGLIIGGVWRARSVKQVNSEPEVVLTPQVTSTPSPSPLAADYSELKVQILNGSGIEGEAGRVADLLIEEGFIEANIETANAKSFDYEETEVRVKSTLEESVYTTLQELLEDEDYTVEEGTELASSNEYDLVITVGAKEGAVRGASTAATATPKPTLPPSPSASGAAEATPSASSGQAEE